MEHREPPRIPAGDRRFDGTIEEPASSFRLRAFDPLSNPRRIDFLRASLIAARRAGRHDAFVLSGFARNDVCRCLAASPVSVPGCVYEIELTEKLPSWYRGGNREFLDRVRRASGESVRISQLQIRPERLALAFKLDPWVEEVVKVSYHPGKIRVDLRFREPVAWVKTDRVLRARRRRRAIVTRRRRGFGAGRDFAQDHRRGPEGPPSDPRAGVLWKAKSESDQIERMTIESSLLPPWRGSSGSACRRGTKVSPALQMIEIIVSDFDIAAYSC